MTPFTCPHWTDLTVAWVAGLTMGLTVGMSGGIWLYRKVDIRRIREHSQFPHTEAE